MFPLAPTGLGSTIQEDRATDCWLDLTTDAAAHPEARGDGAGSVGSLDLGAVLGVLAEDGPVAEDSVGEILFLEGGHT